MNSKRQVNINGLTIGGNAPVRVESMLKISLDKRDECTAQCERLIKSGCEMARAALPDAKFAPDLKALLESTRLVIMADIHFDPALAILAIEAGCRAIRINPGNMPLNRLNDVISCAKSSGVVIRIGANGGSVSQSQLDAAKGDRAEALFIA
ncbi:MAG: flavodoxin-dependent (E)-4-hydroxy-3-methylbut-2-enyl-diphosphate synthase, partial [Synergistaceae bacterium]|nr:flavodoxin-dependent (E)-4-hydroxy-3-methylbut-2-enyl-diphosphate synthase [Synergistaceae bacterium]